MRSVPSLGSANVALISLYFVPIWGGDALRALTSPFHGFEDRVHATAAIYFRQLFDFGLDGLVRRRMRWPASSSWLRSRSWPI